jgi:DNA-binding GntR family transcriptional regulator
MTISDALDAVSRRPYLVDNMQDEAIELPAGLARLVAERLADAIVYNEFGPGEPLREEVLTRRFRISRSPIREAFRILEQEGLVVFLPRRGVRVAPLSRDRIAEIYECRAVLEAMAAGRAAEHATAEALASLKRTYRRMAAAAARRDIRRYFEHNVELQTRIRTLGGNATLGRLLDGLGRQTLRYRYIVYVRAPELIATSLRRNAEILAAIEAGDGVRARQLTESLIVEAGQLALKHLPVDLTAPLTHPRVVTPATRRTPRSVSIRARRSRTR